MNKIIIFFNKVREDTSFKGSVLLSIGQVMFAISGYAVNVGLARLLGPLEFGKYGVIISILVWLEILLSVGYASAVAKMVAEHPAAAKKIIGLVIKKITKWGGIILFICVIFSPVLADIFKDPKIKIFLPVAAIDLLFYGSYRIYLRANTALRNFKKSTAIIVIYSLAKIIFILTPVALGTGVIFALIGNFIASIVGALAGFFYIRNLKDKENFEVNDFNQKIKITLPITVWATSAMLIMSMDIWVAKALVGGQQMGYYVVASTIAKLTYFLSLGIRGLVLPEVSRKESSEDFRGAMRYLYKLLLLFLVIFIPFVLVLQVFPEAIIKLLFSAVYISAVPLLKVLSVGYFFITLSEFFALTLIAVNRARLVAVIFGFLGAVSIPVNFYFVSKIGIIGAAYGLGILSGIGLLITGALTFSFFMKKIKNGN